MAIALEQSVRTNLAALQGITKVLARTEQRLATGKKVNSIIDNPTGFFANRSLNDRADTLNARLDGMSNAIQTLNAATAGVDAIRTLLANAKALAQDAIAKGNVTDRRVLGEQFNIVIEQAFEIATDASFNGINLLQNNQMMSVEFGDSNGDSNISIRGLDIQGADGNGVSEVKVNSTATRASTSSAGSTPGITGQVSTASIASVASGGSTAAVASVASQSSVASNPTVASQGSVSNNGSGATQASLGSSVSTTAQASVTSFAGLAVAASGGSAASTASQQEVATRPAGASGGSSASVSVSFTQSFALSLQPDASDPSRTIGLRKHGANPGSSNGNHRVDFGANNYIDILNQITREVDAMDEALAVQTARLATSLNIVQVRQTFTQSLINTLETGADNLVLADMNQEGANLITLQTRHALAIQSLSISSSQTQQILNLII